MFAQDLVLSWWAVSLVVYGRLIYLGVIKGRRDRLGIAAVIQSFDAVMMTAVAFVAPPMLTAMREEIWAGVVGVDFGLMATASFVMVVVLCMASKRQA